MCFIFVEWNQERRDSYLLDRVQEAGALGISALSRLTAHLIVAAAFSMRTNGKPNLIQSFPGWRGQQNSFRGCNHNSDLFFSFPHCDFVKAMEFFKSCGSKLVPQGQLYKGIDRYGSSQFYLDLGVRNSAGLLQTYLHTSI